MTNTSPSIETKISFVLPVFNMEAYLERCLDSIADQTSTRWEAILIDDGSTDLSSMICKKYEEQNSKFKYFRQSNQGQGAARNKGVSLATGDYVCFIDPDDWIEKNTTKELLTLMDLNNADFANFGIDFFTQAGKTRYVFNDFDQEELNGRSIFEKAMLDNQIYSSPCNKIYRISFLNRHKIQFPHLRSYEDIFYSRKLSLHAEKCLFTKRIYYHALIRNGSTTREMTIQKVIQALEAIEFEKNNLLNNDSFEMTTHLVNAHILKFTSSLIFQAAFRVVDKLEYIDCVNLINNFRSAAVPSPLKAISLLTFKNQVMLQISKRPQPTRYLSSLLSLIRITPY